MRARCRTRSSATPTLSATRKAASERGGNRPTGASGAVPEMGRKPRTATAKADSGAPQPSFRAAARSVLRRPAPTPRRGRKVRRSGGQGARSFTTGALAEDYLRLCRDPLRDLQRWMDEDKKRGRVGRGVQLITRRGEDAAKNTTPAADYLAHADRLRREPLHELQGRLDTDRAGGRSTRSVPGRQRACARRYDGLQQVQGAERSRTRPKPLDRRSRGRRVLRAGHRAGRGERLLRGEDRRREARAITA